MMNTVDPAVPVFSFAGVAGLGQLPTLNPVDAETWDSGDLFDVSGYDSWSLFGQVIAFGARPALVTLAYFDQLVDDPHPGSVSLPTTGLNVEQNVFAPTATQAAAGTQFMVAGRTLGPVLGVTLDGTGGQYRLDLFVHNRTRLYDTPYTPGPLGQLLAAIPVQAMAANATLTADLPYYMGPAIVALETGVAATSPTTSIRARVIDSAANVVASSFPEGGTTSPFWLPGISSSGVTKYKLDLLNNTVAISAGASVVAA